MSPTKGIGAKRGYLLWEEGEIDVTGLCRFYGTAWTMHETKL